MELNIYTDNILLGLGLSFGTLVEVELWVRFSKESYGFGISSTNRDGT